MFGCGQTSTTFQDFAMANITTTAALIQCLIAFCVVLFQIALTFGAPWGEWAMGGQHPGVLPTNYRIATAISAVIMLAQSGHYLAQAGLLTPLLPPELNAAANWFWFGLGVLSLILNAISRSKKERNLWVPVLLVSVVCTLIVALNS